MASPSERLRSELQMEAAQLRAELWGLDDAGVRKALFQVEGPSREELIVERDAAWARAEALERSLEMERLTSRAMATEAVEAQREAQRCKAAEALAPRRCQERCCESIRGSSAPLQPCEWFRVQGTACQHQREAQDLQQKLRCCEDELQASEGARQKLQMLLDRRPEESAERTGRVATALKSAEEKLADSEAQAVLAHRQRMEVERRRQEELAEVRSHLQHLEANHCQLSRHAQRAHEDAAALHFERRQNAVLQSELQAALLERQSDRRPGAKLKQALKEEDTGSHATSEFWCPDEAVTAITEPTALAPAAAAPEVPPFQETRSQQDLVMLPPPKVIRIVSDEGSGGFSQFSSSPASPSTRSHDERRTQKYLDATVPDPVIGPLVQDPVTRIIQSGERYFSPRQVYGPS
ncbi:unnamed protein product [Effrenium voratum]|nr:unnamed protein product [Effrenium voratum]